MADLHKNFAISKVAGAPSPATSGTSLAVTTGDGTKFPTTPFNAIVWPANTQPSTTNAEIVRVTAVSTDTFSTISRSQESSNARTITVGDQIMAGITAKSLTDIEGSIYTPATKVVATTASGIKADYYTSGTSDNVIIQQALDAVNVLGGGTVLIKEGTYNISSRLLVYNNTWLKGTGIKTILKKTSGVSNARIITNADDVGGNSNIHISDLYIDGNHEVGDTGIAFNMAKVNVGLVERVWVVNGMQGFKSDTSIDLTYRDCIADGNYNWNYYSYSGTRVKFLHCKSLNAKADTNEGFGMAFYNNNVDGQAVGNYIYNSAGNALQVNSGTATQDVTGMILKDNKIDTSANRGIMVTDDGSAFHVKKISIVNNRVTNTTSIGIYLVDGYDAYVAGNKSYSNTGDGIAYENCVNVLSEGNTSTGNNAGFRIVGDGTSVVSLHDFVYSNTQNFANTTASGVAIVGPTDFTLNGQATRTITLSRPYVSAAGNNLTIQAGPATSGSTNLAGGTLNLNSGIATGTGRSQIVFNLASPGSSGTTDITPTQAAVMGISGGTTMFGLLRSTTSFAGSPTPTNSMVLNGTGAGGFVMVRNTGSNSAGSNVTVQAGGAFSGGVSKNGGNLLLTSGIATGTGSSQIQLQTASASATGIIQSISLASGGSGYVVSDTVTITGGGGTGATATVLTVDGTGAILTLSLTVKGTGYAITTGATVSGGTGTGATINILTVDTQDNAPSTKMTVLGSGNIGVGQTTPTAVLHLKAGTATANTAPLKLTAGINLATPEDGAIEYDGTHYYGTIGSTRYQFDQQSGTGGGVTSVTGTTSRITSTGGVTPAIDIDAAYVGQTSITTLGTITTGTWNGTAIDHTKLTGIAQADVAGLTTASTPTFTGANLGTGALNTVGNIEVDGTAARDVTVGRTAGTTGANLTVQAGGAVSGGTNTAGGNLLLSSGISTGSAGSNIQFWVASTGSSGTTDRTPAQGAVLFSTTATQPVLSITSITGSSAGLPVSTNAFAISGNAAGGFSAYRHTAANNSGNTMTIQAGGATNGATDKNGGDLILKSGISTGVGASKIRLQTWTSATATGTSDNTSLDRTIINSPKILTNNSAIALVNATLASNTVAAGVIRYAVEVFNGTDLQVEQGAVSYMATNKGGVFSGNTVVKYGNQQAVTTGTLTATFAITGANPAVLSVNANSSLTPSAGYPRITYTIENLTQQAIAIQ